MTKVGLFYKEKESKEVFEVVSVDGDSIKINHTVEDEAWIVTPEILSSDYTRLRGLKAQRAEILADVIKQIELQFLNPRNGTYTNFNLKDEECEYFGFHIVNWDDIKLSSIKNQQVNSFLQEKVKSCEACAIGGVFLSAVDIHDKLKIKSVTSDTSMIKYLKEWFDNIELRLMEFAFEGQYYYRGSVQSRTEVNTFRDEVKEKYKCHFECPPEESLKEIIANTLKYDKFSPQKGPARKKLDERKTA